MKRLLSSNTSLTIEVSFLFMDRKNNVSLIFKGLTSLFSVFFLLSRNCHCSQNESQGRKSKNYHRGKWLLGCSPKGMFVCALHSCCTCLWVRMLGQQQAFSAHRLHAEGPMPGMCWGWGLRCRKCILVGCLWMFWGCLVSTSWIPTHSHFELSPAADQLHWSTLICREIQSEGNNHRL